MVTIVRPVPVYTTKGDLGALLVYPYLYNPCGEWIGWVTPEREVYSVLGVFVGRLGNPPRILRRRADEYQRPRKSPPFIPQKIYPPANIPLPPMMPELAFDTIDVFIELPNLLHTIDSGELKEDLG